MRLRLVGYSGVRPPIPGTQVVPPEDPGPTPDPIPDDIPPPITLVLNNGDVFHKGDYLALGYNRFDVMCIGAAGGSAGTVKEIIPDSHQYQDLDDHTSLLFDAYRYVFGGAGGGGGVMRTKGRLALLPTNIPVVVGQPGADGGYSEVHSPLHYWPGNPPYGARPIPPPGGNGGASSFGGVICRASGGKGGNDLSGGPSGIGNADGAGGGSTYSWQQGVTTDPTTGTRTPAGINPGKWDGKIGSGGAGGRGSIVQALSGDFASGGAQMGQDPNGGHNGYSSAGDGAPGAYSSADASVSGKSQLGSGFGLDYSYVSPMFYNNGSWSGFYKLDPAHYDVVVAVPGFGGGATAFPLTGDLTQYGSKAEGHDGKGAVIIRLTYAIV